MTFTFMDKDGASNGVVSLIDLLRYIDYAFIYSQNFTNTNVMVLEV